MPQETTQLIRATPELKAIDRPLTSGNLSSGYLYETAPESEHIAYLREFLRSLRKHLWLVLGLTLCATAASAVYNARKPDVYEARAQVRVDQESNTARGAIGANAPIIVSGNQTMDPQYFNTQLQILTGPALMRRIAKLLDLEHNPSFFRSPNENRTVLQSLLYMAGLNKEAIEKKTDQDLAPIAPTAKIENLRDPTSVEATLEEAKRYDRYVRTMLGNLKVSQVRDTRLINISYQHQDAQVAANIVNSIAATYVRSNMESKTGKMENEGEFLKQRISQLQNEVKNDNLRLNQYAKDTGTLALGDKTQDVVVERLAQLNRELVLAENALRLAEAQYKVGSEQKVVEATNAKETIDLEKRLNELEQKRAKLKETFTNEWREVKEVDAEIATIQKQIEDTKSRRGNTTLTTLEANYREALRRKQDLSAAFEKQKNVTRIQNTTAVNYKIIQDEIDTKNKLLDELIQKDKQIDMTRAGNTNNIMVQEYGLVPNQPIGPKRTQGILLAFLLSFAFGIGLARLLDYLDTTVRTVQDIEKHLRLPVLSLIPSVGGWRRIAPSTALQKGDMNHTEELLIRSDMRSPLAETYRQLRTSILLSTAGRAPKTLLITSSQASEGKTTNAVNVAYTLTQTGAKVLIIDADMRRPRLHNIFQMENTRGLSTILSSEMTEAEILSIIMQYESTGVYVLPSGPLPPNPSELLSSDAMRRFLGILEGIFAHVVIDSPPITLVTDSVILGSMVDGVLLVVQGDRTSRELVRRSQRLLHEVGARVFGVILNNVNIKPEDYYYYQSYYASNYYAGDKG